MSTTDQLSSVAYDIIKTSRLVGPTTVEGTLSVPDDIVTNDVFFVPEGNNIRDVTALMPRAVDVTGVGGAVIGQQVSLVFACVDPVTGVAEDRIIFSCPAPIDPLAPVVPTNPAICLPGFEFQTGDVVGFVGYDADGCFRPVSDSGIVDIVCEELAADVDCVVSLGLAILGQAEPGGLLNVAFCATVNTCLPDFFSAIAVDPVAAPGAPEFSSAVFAVIPPFFAAIAADPVAAPGATEFCDAVEACLPDFFAAIAADPVTAPGAPEFVAAVIAAIGEDGPGLADALACEDLILGALQYETSVQGPCVEPVEPVTALNAAVAALQVPPPPTDIPGSVWFSVFGDPVAEEPTEPIPFLEIDPLAIPPTVGINTGFVGDVSTEIYTFDPSADHAYMIEFYVASKVPADAEPVPVTLSIVGVPVPVPATIPVAGEATAVKYSFLLNTVGETPETPILMEANEATTLLASDITAALTAALTGAGVDVGVIGPLITGLGDALIITAPGISSTVNADGTVTFFLVGALPGADISVKVNVTRAPLEEPVVTTVASLKAKVSKKKSQKKQPSRKFPVGKATTKKLPVKKSAPVETPKVEGKKKQVRILSKLLSKK